MVLYKRKPVEFLPHPENIRSITDSNIWEIKETAEVFLTYETYLLRRDFYLRKVFTCESTGRSGIDFFSALESEQNRTQELSHSFPNALRRVVLRHVQFSTVSRLEQLVNEVHDAYKNEFFPKEHVICTRDNGDRVLALIREKVSFGEEILPDGSVGRESYARYTVTIKADGREEDAEFETGSLTRERRNFSKVLLRDFLKSSLTKEAWHGAPWIVKEHLAREFDLPLEVPPHLQQSARIAEKKALAQQKKAHLEYQRQQAEQSMLTITDFRQYPYSRKNGGSLVPSGPPTANQPWQSKPGGKQKNRFIQHNFQQFPGLQGSGEYPFYNPNDPNQGPYSPNGMQGFVHFPGDHPDGVNGQNFMGMKGFPPFPPPIKYPIEDLDIPPKPTDLRRPAFKSFTDLPCAGAEHDGETGAGKYSAESIGPLLEVWNTLNVHNEVYILDSFTLDDFAQALRFSSPDVECELLAEVHCAVLKLFVDEDGKLLVDLPQLDDASDSSSSEDEESEEEEEAEPEPEPPRRTTRSSMAKAEAAIARTKSPTPDPLAHRAVEFQADNPWQERCKDREFANNRWQPVLVGLLYQISLSENMKDRCENLLRKLLPPELEPTEETIMDEYVHLDVSDRLDALQLIVMLSLRTKAIREHLERMTLEMTELRKKRIELQRQKKELIDQLQELDVDRKALVAEIAPEPAATEEKEEEESEPIIAVEANGHHSSADDSDDQAPRLRRGAERVHERKRKREEEVARKDKEKKAKNAATKLTKAELKLKKLESEIDAKKDEIRECEDSIQDVTNDLRETDCQRTRCLGRDRFCNRYYWFERNGMPFSGVPLTSTSHYGYANGRLWIQGPDDMERDGFIDVPKEEQEKYKEKFGITLVERRESEEGDTHLHSASNWGYFDDAQSVDELIAWLDERGTREKALRKELQTWRDVMVECMDKLRIHLGDADEETPSSVPATRVSTRTKTYVNLETTKWLCLKWHNSMALEEMGMRHSDGIRRKRREAKKPALDKKGKAVKKGK